MAQLQQQLPFLGATSFHQVLLGMALLALAFLTQSAQSYNTSVILTKSGLYPWVDVNTDSSDYYITSSRGDNWTLIMSDEFEDDSRNFTPGNDYLWTAIEMADGTNSALEYYSFNMTYVEDGNFVIKTDTANITYTVYNEYADPPGYESDKMYYRSGMVQSWNKFCIQGGRIEVRAQLPYSNASSNSDLNGSTSDRVEETDYYPTWPGIWLMGNLGRALFTSTTRRMWPWTYNVCDEDYEQSQRISACNGTPGHDMNPYQGRGAPEIDILEGGGTDISSSLQVAPGMPDDFRMISPNSSIDTSSYSYCYYSKDCETDGANGPGIPTSTYEARGHASWYQDLKYSSNHVCTAENDTVQTISEVLSQSETGWTDNLCSTINACPASWDGYGNLSQIDDTEYYWNINSDGTCFPKINGYMGAYLCDMANNATKCDNTLSESVMESYTGESFEYQMDAVSTNWPIHLQAYTGFVLYQLEWVPGDSGYVRWMIEGHVIFEIPASAFTDPPEDSSESNPKKIMIEEPSYFIFNVALSSTWGVYPPNAGETCMGDDGSASSETEDICNSFPMYMRIDYIRVYQDVSDSSIMGFGCDPETHPTATWISDNIEDYEYGDNTYEEVVGGAPCSSSDDCTVGSVDGADFKTGHCSSNRCVCYTSDWIGPRCTTAASDGSYGPSIYLAIGISAFIIVVTVGVIVYVATRSRKSFVSIKPQTQGEEEASAISRESRASGKVAKANGGLV